MDNWTVTAVQQNSNAVTVRVSSEIAQFYLLAN